VFLAELKRDEVNLDTLEQLEGYWREIRCYYPDHAIRGYLIGKQCVDRNGVEAAIADRPIKILVFDGRDLPLPEDVDACPRCGPGAAFHRVSCEVCGGRLRSG
jgi:hypothetical protein